MDDIATTRRRVFPLLAIALTAGATAAQSACYHFGSHPMVAAIEASPTTLGCTAAPAWPHWHLFTPAHRQPGPHLGFNPGHARPLPRILVAYQCTGFLLLPVIPVHVRTMGYVVDQPEIACTPLRS